jgi:RNA polymerase sigma-70 factor, ECF subfamily
VEEIEEIYHKYKKDVYNFLIYYMKTADIDDVFQETFINAFNALNKKISINNTRSWLITIARNTAIDFIRKRNRDKKSVLSLKTNYLHKEQHSIEEIIQADENEKGLINSIDKLKKDYQEVVILRGIKEFSVAETAEILNWNENKVRITFHRAIKKLSVILEQEGDFIGYK